MKYTILILLLVLPGCQKPHDEKLEAWISHAGHVDYWVHGGMSIWANGMIPSVQNDKEGHTGKSENKAASLLLEKEQKWERVGPVFSTKAYTAFPTYTFRARNNGNLGYVVMTYLEGKSADQKTHIHWLYRFYTDDFFIELERKYKKTTEPNQRLQTMRFKFPINAIAQGPHV